MSQLFQLRRSHLRITKDASRFSEAKVGGDHDIGSVVELQEEMEQECAS